MCNELVKILRAWKLKCPHSDKDIVFPNSVGNYQDGKNMDSRIFKQILRKAGIDDEVTWHSLRHTYTSILISKNISPKYIQNQLDHGSSKVTMDIYAHSTPEDSIRGMEVLDNLVNKKADSIKFRVVTPDGFKALKRNIS